MRVLTLITGGVLKARSVSSLKVPYMTVVAEAILSRLCPV